MNDHVRPSADLKRDFTATFSVDRSPAEVFAAINDVRSWWTGEITGPTDVVGAEFTYRHNDIHRSTHRVTQLVAGQRVVWHVTEAELSSFTDTKEWNDTEIVFDLSKNGDRTEVRFTHVGLAPAVECYDQCSRAWTFFVTDSLKKRILEGPRAAPPNRECRA